MRRTDCHTPPGGSINQDGYVRVLVGSRTDGTRKLMMRHRKVWEDVNGDIPEGHEIDHLCRNRACCNLEHLRVLPRKLHKIYTNATRHLNTIYEGKRMIRDGRDVKFIAEKVGRSVATVNRWKRELEGRA